MSQPLTESLLFRICLEAPDRQLELIVADIPKIVTLD